ncbi:MAG: VWA-like domain-containing protein, partial [Acidobacteriota bacterium]|nr:VWA-like domain-containing protein [Acidobacteriota bacterium]
VYADARVTGEEEFTAVNLPLRLHPSGGGGTSFGPALEHFEGDPPECLLYFTDLEGSFPRREPSFPVLWLVIGQPLAAPTAPFGEVVLLPY